MTTQKLDHIWTNFIQGWKIKTVALVLAALGIMSDHLFPHDLGAKLTIAFVFVIAISIYEAIYGVHHHSVETAKEVIEHHDRVSADMLKKVARIEDKIDIQTNDLLVLNAINNNEGAIRHVLKTTYDSLKNTLAVHPDNSFGIHDHSLALKTYVDFWRHLVDDQRERNLNGGAALTALVVHRNDIGIWDDPLLSSVFWLQKKFTEEGGRVYRILCGREKEPDQRYVAIARRMIEARVEVFYCNMTDAVVTANTGLWDFLLVKETKQAVIWKDVNVDGKIDTATFTGNPTEGNKQLAEIWQRIRHESVPFTHFPQAYLES